jgi:hypothetical protein
MDPVDELAVVLAPLLPLRIDEAEYSDPHLMVMGAGWSLALIGAWEWKAGDLVITKRGEDTTEDVVWDPVGYSLIGVRGAKGTADFALSGGGVLRARGDGSGFEFWTFRHRALQVVHVGT